MSDENIEKNYKQNKRESARATPQTLGRNKIFSAAKAMVKKYPHVRFDPEEYCLYLEHFCNHKREEHPSVCKKCFKKTVKLPSALP